MDNNTFGISDQAYKHAATAGLITMYVQEYHDMSRLTGLGILVIFVLVKETIDAYEGHGFDFKDAAEHLLGYLFVNLATLV